MVNSPRVVLCGGFVMGVGELLRSLVDFVKEYGSLISIGVGLVAVPFGGYELFKRKVWRKLKDLWRTDIRQLKARIQHAEQRLDGVRRAFDDNNDIWLRQPVDSPPGYDKSVRESIPI